MFQDFQKRISYSGDLKILLNQVCNDYDFGEYKEHTVILVGYEDLNAILITSKGKYFVKILANFRPKEDCKQYVNLMLAVVNAGIAHPKLYQSKNGEYLYEFKSDNTTTYVSVMEYVDGKTFYDLDEKPTSEELAFLANQAALINQLSVETHSVYDSWAIVNFIPEFEKKKQYLEKEDLLMIEPLAEEFRKINLENLPRAFVHGDIIRTNVIRSNNNKLYIFDFSVSNYYPRIQELAVLFCDLFFNEKDPSKFKENYELGLFEYQKQIKLTNEELDTLPLYTKIAHAMHILYPTYEKKVNGNDTLENQQWLDLGRKGLTFTTNFWS